MTSTLDASPMTGTSDGSGALTQVKDATLEKTEQARRRIGSQVSDRVRDEADQRSTQLGEHVSSIASALHDTSSSLRSSGDGTPAKAVDAVTEHVEHLGSYLRNVDGESLLHDLEDAARRRPWATAATLFGVGFAVSRVLGASSRSRYESRGGQISRPRPSGGYSQYPDGGASTMTGSTLGGLQPSTVGADPYAVGGLRNDSY